METEIQIDGVIGTATGEVSSTWFKSQLPADGSPIVVRIHSEGGSVVEGFRIYDLAAAYPGKKRAVIESAAYSIASFIPMAFDDVEITPNGYIMLHNPYMGVEGDDEELYSKAGFLRKLKETMIDAYASKSGKAPADITAILKQESYLNATEAVAEGFADRMTKTPVIGRVFARIDSMPHQVVTALFGAGLSGDTPNETQTMATPTPTAATVKEIKQAFPKAKSDFIVRCMEDQLPLEDVATLAAEESMTELEELTARNMELEEQLAKLQAQVDDEAEAKAKAEEDEAAAKAEEEAEAKAKRSGARPVAHSSGGKPSARAQWKAAIDEALTRCNGNRAKAVAQANRSNPGLRQAMVDEINS